MTPDPNLPLLEEAAAKLKPFLGEIVFVGGVTFGLLITDAAGAAIRGTNDVDVIAEILTYADTLHSPNDCCGQGLQKRRGEASRMLLGTSGRHPGRVATKRESAGLLGTADHPAH